MANYIRKSADALNKTEQDAYIKGITDLIADGTYGKLVAIHSNMRHKMHTMGRFPSGRLRFLPWHRAYLLHMEAELRKKVSDAFIPCWNSTLIGVPDWIKSFQPELDIPGVGKVQKNTRTVLTGPITNPSRYTDLLGINSYNKFTDWVESNPHNTGHGRLGTPMDTVQTAPADPMFFMHHAEIDRLWAEWQVKYPTAVGPILTGNDAIMDPWSDTVSSLTSISTLGYSYA